MVFEIDNSFSRNIWMGNPVRNYIKPSSGILQSQPGYPERNHDAGFHKINQKQCPRKEKSSATDYIVEE